MNIMGKLLCAALLCALATSVAGTSSASTLSSSSLVRSASAAAAASKNRGYALYQQEAPRAGDVRGWENAKRLGNLAVRGTRQVGVDAAEALGAALRRRGKKTPRTLGEELQDRRALQDVSRAVALAGALTKNPFAVANYAYFFPKLMLPSTFSTEAGAQDEAIKAERRRLVVRADRNRCLTFS